MNEVPTSLCEALLWLALQGAVASALLERLFAGTKWSSGLKEFISALPFLILPVLSLIGVDLLGKLPDNIVGNLDQGYALALAALIAWLGSKAAHVVRKSL